MHSPSFYGEVLNVQICGSLLLTETGYEAGAALNRHSHADSHLAVLLEGSYFETRGTKKYLCLPGDAVFYHAGQEHQNLFGKRPGRCLNVEFASARERDTPTVKDSLTPKEIEALYLGPSRVSPPSWILHARRQLDSDPDISLTPLARKLSVAPCTLARGFRKAFGISVGGYANLRRLRRAAQLLINSEDPIADISLCCGYFDQSHFTNAFSAVTGFSPSGLRRLAHLK